MVPIPEGSEAHSEESEYTDYGSPQGSLDQPLYLRGNGGDGSDVNAVGAPADRKPSVKGACELSG
jgi:hypothetical protein